MNLGPQALIVDPKVRQYLRQLALFLTMLLSGGSLIFPRVPLAVATIAITFLLRSPTTVFRREFGMIWLFMAGIGMVTLISWDSGYHGGLVGRYGAFFAAIAMLAVYIFERKRQIVEDLLPMLRLMAVQAIITTVLATTVPGIFRPVALADNSTVYTIFHVLTYHDLAQMSSIKRPNGFFWEPGIFQIYANLFFFLAAFYARRRMDILLSVVAVAVIQSTTGMIILSLVAAVAIANHLRQASVAQVFAWSALVPVLLAPIIILTMQNVQEKFTGINQGSVWARMFDANTGLNIVMEHPLAGIGFDSQRYLSLAFERADRSTLLSESLITGRASTNGVIEMLAMIGIPLSLVMIWGLFRQRFFQPRWLFAIFMLISLMSEPLIITPFALMIAFSAFLKPGRPLSRGVASRSRVSGGGWQSAARPPVSGEA